MVKKQSRTMTGRRGNFVIVLVVVVVLGLLGRKVI
jgi:hypothetical protein